MIALPHLESPPSCRLSCLLRALPLPCASPPLAACVSRASPPSFPPNAASPPPSCALTLPPAAFFSSKPPLSVSHPVPGPPPLSLQLPHQRLGAKVHLAALLVVVVRFGGIVRWWFHVRHAPFQRPASHLLGLPVLLHGVFHLEEAPQFASSPFLHHTFVLAAPPCWLLLLVCTCDASPPLCPPSCGCAQQPPASASSKLLPSASLCAEVHDLPAVVVLHFDHDHLPSPSCKILHLPCRSARCPPRLPPLSLPPRSPQTCPRRRRHLGTQHLPGHHS
mmetsp:Transcript_29913/g.69549  ORF Transcript_29913/g.69549 Transcript_29913/m.69549 type:complete len:277 (-) Transcript_29913:1165-1995(-)